MLTIGAAIKKARIDKGLSRSELSFEARIPVQNIYQWETDRAYPSIINLIPVADVLGVTLDELVGRTVKADERN
jgi:transcriptional regulator with XRE-family HTH domain